MLLVPTSSTALTVLAYVILLVRQCGQKNSCNLPLPDPSGVLREKMDSSTIEEANKEVSTVIGDSVPQILLPMKYRAPPRLINSKHNVEIYLGTWPTISSPLHKAIAL